MFIKYTIGKSSKDYVAEYATNTKVLLQEIEKRYHKEDIDKASTLVNHLTTITWKVKGNIRE